MPFVVVADLEANPEGSITNQRRAFIWPIMMPARRYLLLNVARAQIGPDKREKTGQTA
jgi:hypothetical protein